MVRRLFWGKSVPDSLPDHDPKDSHERLKRALLACEGLDAAARDAFLAALERDDPEIAAEARDLNAQSTNPALTGSRVAPWVREALEATGRGAGNAAPGVGRALGPYRLVELLGSGGMGVVYRAEQTEPIRREVAVKLLRGGLLPEKLVARFRAEQDALARMEHPGIARIVDAGGDEAGTPYLVMELVRGVPITEYCAARRLAPRQILPIFVDVCRAVQHAHERGIIHRDLKPANILVAEVDGRPAAKI
ncbi:MAG: serine/threonine-protein kinase, partial [Hyphomicrobiales bacterium]